MITGVEERQQRQRAEVYLVPEETFKMESFA